MISLTARQFHRAVFRFKKKLNLCTEGPLEND